jgi:hypothetical protein
MNIDADTMLSPSSFIFFTLTLIIHLIKKIKVKKSNNKIIMHMVSMNIGAITTQYNKRVDVPRSLWACLVSIFLRFWPQNAKARPNRLCFLWRFVTARLWAATNTRVRRFPEKQLPQCVSKKSAPFSSLPPESPAHFKSPPAPNSSPICDSGALSSLPSPAQAPALAPRFATPVRRPVPVTRDSHVDPLSAARAGDPQHPWSITHLVLLHHLADPAEMSP